MYSSLIVLISVLLVTYCHAFKSSITSSSRLWIKTHKSSLYVTSPIDNNLQMEGIKDAATSTIKQKVIDGQIPQSFVTLMGSFFDEYTQSCIESNETPENFKKNIFSFLKYVQDAISQPYKFQPFHQAITSPIDYYTFGNNFIKPLIITEQSKLFGEENVKAMVEVLAKGENIVILSNHQTEVDPQVISILLQQIGMSSLAEKIIYIAGHKVTNDPVAIPFSMGRNLICIHSKKHIKNPPEDIPMKQAQNLDSMKAMSDLILEGGRIFWVAPSGGRDRPNEAGDFVVAPFDVKALDMFKLLAMQTKKPIHFFPMAMYTSKLVPPPDGLSSQLGESRSAKRGPVSVSFLSETDGMGGLKDKEFCADVQQRVNAAFDSLVQFHSNHKN